MRKTFLLVIVWFACSLAQAQQQCVLETFNTPGAGLMYGFSGRQGDYGTPTCSYPVTWPGAGSDEWCVSHQAAADADGSGAAHLILEASSAQSEFGWYRSVGGCTFAAGDTMLVKFRIKYDDHFAFAEDHKILVFQDSGYRTILHSRNGTTAPADCRMNAHAATKFCTNDSSGSPLSCSSNANCKQAAEQYWCLPANVNTSTDGAFSFNKDIAAPCVGPAGAPNGILRSLPLNTWLWVQIEVKKGTSGYMKLWVNNTDYNNPNACTGSSTDCPASGTYGYPTGDGSLNVTSILGSGEVKVGNYWQDAIGSDFGFYFGHLEILKNTAFDTTWGPPAAPREPAVAVTRELTYSGTAMVSAFEDYGTTNTGENTYCFRYGTFAGECVRDPASLGKKLLDMGLWATGSANPTPGGLQVKTCYSNGLDVPDMVTTCASAPWLSVSDLSCCGTSANGGCRPDIWPTVSPSQCPLMPPGSP